MKKQFLLLLLSMAFLGMACDVDFYRPVRASKLPGPIHDYIETEYPSADIRWAKRDDDGYEVKLDNGKELNFDLDGIFLYAD